MRDCGKGPACFGKSGSVYDVNPILRKLRFPKTDAGSRNNIRLFPGSRRMFFRDQETGEFEINLVLETIFRLSRFRIFFL